jgi:hypothetical protein
MENQYNESEINNLIESFTNVGGEKLPEAVEKMVRHWAANPHAGVTAIPQSRAPMKFALVGNQGPSVDDLRIDPSVAAFVYDRNHNRWNYTEKHKAAPLTPSLVNGELRTFVDTEVLLDPNNEKEIIKLLCPKLDVPSQEVEEAPKTNAELTAPPSSPTQTSEAFVAALKRQLAASKGQVTKLRKQLDKITAQLNRKKDRVLTKKKTKITLGTAKKAAR